MRSSQKPSRTRGRGRSKSNGNNVNRVYESAGPEGKVRGTPQQIIDKYLSLARDAQTAGDRVASENFLQHAEHYQRILILAVGTGQERREANGHDGDDDDAPMHAPRNEAEAQNGAHAAESENRGEVTGLTTLGSEDAEEDDLLVETTEETPKPSKSRSRRRRSSANGAPADAADATAESEEPASVPQAEGG